MRQYLIIIVTAALVVLVLVGINAASYVEIEETPDSEYTPDRSTYNGRATGTRALFDYLHESGYKVVRWREQPEKLLSAGTVRPGTFVVAGPTRIPFEPEEIKDLLQWVKSGGRLIVVDRSPDQRILPPSGQWRVTLELQNYPTPDARSSNPDEMTAGVPLARATQPTAFTAGVDSVLASRFAATIKIFAVEETSHAGTRHRKDEETDDDDYDLSGRSSSRLLQTEPPPVVLRKDPRSSATTSSTAPEASPAPVVHLTDARATLLADYGYGAGRIVILSDPFIIANSGISRADNLHLAVNIIGAANDLIAFDEYHHGRATTHNQLLSYFAGTPVIAMLGQLGLIILVAVWTSGRRFARPLPLPSVDRRSKLEFVASMAELQQRSRAYDLAIENIYLRTRRVLARYVGLDSNAPRAEIAERVAARSAINRQELESLMRECEDAMAGEPLSARHALLLVSKLREVERTLGLRMRSREIKQAKER
ncbi:MAG: DUF4350 domain-containing protein [Pyrinomonadaceae bacterium]|nr:DUF4350 domain-containing protein [Pyrinomonadaceae bacterium]